MEREGAEVDAFTILANNEVNQKKKSNSGFLFSNEPIVKSKSGGMKKVVNGITVDLNASNDDKIEKLYSQN